FLQANNVTAGSWCGTTKFAGLEASGNIDLVAQATLPPNRIPFGYPKAASFAMRSAVGVDSVSDPGFVQMADNQASSLYASNADRDTRSDMGSPKDNCLQNSNPAQTDADNNGIGD